MIYVTKQHISFLSFWDADTINADTINNEALRRAKENGHLLIVELIKIWKN